MGGFYTCYGNTINGVGTMALAEGDEGENQDSLGFLADQVGEQRHNLQGEA